MFEWLADHVSVFKMQHNAHREFNMSVEQHLLHRDRIGDAPMFLDARDRAACVARSDLWELRLILPDGAAMNVAGSSLDKCLTMARSVVGCERMPHLAA